MHRKSDRNRRPPERRCEHWLLKFYNSLNQGKEAATIEDIPEEARVILAFLDFHDLVKPFIAMDIREGQSRDQAAIKYGVTPGYAREIGRRYGFFPRKNPVTSNQRPKDKATK